MNNYRIHALFSGVFRGVIIPQTAGERTYRQILPKVWEPLFGGSSLIGVVGKVIFVFAMTQRRHCLCLESTEQISLRGPHWWECVRFQPMRCEANWLPAFPDVSDDVRGQERQLNKVLDTPL